MDIRDTRDIHAWSGLPNPCYQGYPYTDILASSDIHGKYREWISKQAWISEQYPYQYPCKHGYFHGYPWSRSGNPWI